MKKRTLKPFVLLIGILLLGIIFSTCKKDPKNPDPNDTKPVPETTKIIDESTWQANVISIDSSNYTFTFNENLANIITLKAGDILVSSVGEGYLRKVTSITQENGKIKVYTEFASLNEAVRDGDFNLNIVLSEQKINKITYMRDGIKIDTSQMKSTEATNIEASIDDYLDMDHKVHITGSFSLLPSINCELEIRMFKVKKFSINYEIEEQINLATTLEILNVAYSNEVELVNITFTPITVMIATVPVVIVPELEIKLGANLNIESNVTTSIDQQMSYAIGLLYENETWASTYEQTNSFTYQPPTLTAEANAKAYLKPQLSFKVYGTVAPYIYGEAYARINADLLANPWWVIYGGANVGAGVKMEIFGKEIFDWPETPFYLFEYEDEVVNSTDLQQNQAPLLPSNPQPENGAIDTPTNVNLSWQCVDPDSDQLTFDVYFGTNSEPPIWQSNITDFSVNTGLLQQNTNYYWKVVAKDNHDHTTEGTIWQFKTLSTTGNQPPAMPSSPNPVPGATEVSLSVTLTWNCTDPENDPILYDVYFGTTDNPPIAYTNLNSTLFQPTELLHGTQYYWKIVAKDNHDNATESDLWTFETNTDDTGGTVTDIDGNIYTTVIIGTQEWMAENLKVTHYRNGEPIPNVTDGTEWDGLTTGAYCWYDNDEPTYGDTYGALYNWFTVDDSRELCPEGWHIPSDTEWTTLANYLGGTWEAGIKMKSTSGWINNGNGNNESGFTGLPGGQCTLTQGFWAIGYHGNWWSSSEIDIDFVSFWRLQSNLQYLGNGNSSRTFGHSVRCVKD